MIRLNNVVGSYRTGRGSIIFWALNYNALFTGNTTWLVAPIVATILLFLGLFLTSTGFNAAFASRRGVA